MNQQIIQSFLLALTLVSAENASACKCSLATREFKSAAKLSPLLFSGELVSVTRQKAVGLGGEYFIFTYKFVPTKIWRGTQQDTITLVSGHNNCEVQLTASRYVIFTNPAHDLVCCERIIGSNVDKEAMRLDKLFVRKRFKKLQAIG